MNGMLGKGNAAWGLVIAASVLLWMGAGCTAQIRPGEVWRDTNGKPINAHGAGVMFHEGTYYWYGENKEGKTWLPRVTWNTKGPRPVPVVHYYRGYAAPETIADADNDLALGQMVEAISRSKYWKDTCIFVVEDDPQNGFDQQFARATRLTQRAIVGATFGESCAEQPRVSQEIRRHERTVTVPRNDHSLPVHNSEGIKEIDRSFCRTDDLFHERIVHRLGITDYRHRGVHEDRVPAEKEEQG